jgi:putative cofactor-binding repeat protein
MIPAICVPWSKFTRPGMMAYTVPVVCRMAHGGIYVAAGPGTVIEGDLPKGPVVVLRWDSLEALKAWKDSPDFVAAHEIGMKYAKFNIVAVNGATQ